MTLSISTIPNDHAATGTERVIATSQAQLECAVLRVSALPRRLRPVIESLMVECLHTESPWSLSETDPLTAHWCTQWHRDPATPGTVHCCEVLSAPVAELCCLRSRLSELATAEGLPRV